MPVFLHDTMSREKRPLLPKPGRDVYGMYCCGPTVYGPAHIGNFRTFTVQDVLRRTLEVGGLKVKHVRNITDVDDKTIRGAQAAGQTLGDFTKKWTDKFHADCQALGLLTPHVEPSAVVHIPQQVAMIKALVDRGHAYVAKDGSVYFKVCSCPDYGKLNHIDFSKLETQSENSAGEANDADEYERESASDFALWKSRKPEDGANFWPSPWGEGRPGWHIECSAMSLAHLGATFDLHGGGIDLCFPHHENEIAQSEGANGQPLAKVWMHNGFINIDNEKMSKSLGNFFTIRDVLKTYDAETVRFFVVRSHYRSPLNYSNVHLDDARGALKRMYTALHSVAADAVTIDWTHPFAARFQSAMNEDFGTPEAVAVLFDLASEVNRSQSAALAGLLKALGGILGLLQGDPQSFLQSGSVLDDAAIQLQIQARAAAKGAKNFAEADRIRQDLLVQGIALKDSPTGTTWEASS